jgi:hypothetical protein
VERPDPLWYCLPDGQDRPGIRGMDRPLAHENWNALGEPTGKLAVANPDKDGDWQCQEWWEVGKGPNRRATDHRRLGRAAREECWGQMREWARSEEGRQTSKNLTRILRHYAVSARAQNPTIDNGGWVSMNAILGAMNDRAQYEQMRARDKRSREIVQPHVHACHILAVARYGEMSRQGEKVTAHRYQIAIIR